MKSQKGEAKREQKALLFLCFGMCVIIHHMLVWSDLIRSDMIWWNHKWVKSSSNQNTWCDLHPKAHDMCCPLFEKMAKCLEKWAAVKTVTFPVSRPCPLPVRSEDEKPGPKRRSQKRAKSPALLMLWYVCYHIYHMLVWSDLIRSDMIWDHKWVKRSSNQNTWCDLHPKAHDMICAVHFLKKWSSVWRSEQLWKQWHFQCRDPVPYL